MGGGGGGWGVRVLPCLPYSMIDDNKDGGEFLHETLNLQRPPSSAVPGAEAPPSCCACPTCQPLASCYLYRRTMWRPCA